MAIEAFEVRNPSFSDMGLEAQVEAGINDWCAVDARGREFFRQSRAAAVEACREFNRIDVHSRVSIRNAANLD